MENTNTSDPFIETIKAVQKVNAPALEALGNHLNLDGKKMGTLDRQNVIEYIDSKSSRLAKGSDYLKGQDYIKINRELGVQIPKKPSIKELPFKMPNGQLKQSAQAMIERQENLAEYLTQETAGGKQLPLDTAPGDKSKTRHDFISPEKRGQNF